MKLIEVAEAKEFASTIMADPILKMAVNAVLDNAPAYDGAGSKQIGTEYERIQAMSPKELGKFLCSLMSADECYDRCPAREYCRPGHNGMEKYLSRPAKEA